MKQKTLNLSKKITPILCAWDGVEAVTLNEASHEDILSPNFVLALDVYHSAALPSEAERAVSYAALGSEAVMFEFSKHRDRFLYGDLPVHIDLKSTADIEAEVKAAESGAFDGKKDTYSFYRIKTGEALFARGQWFSSIIQRLSDLGSVFWDALQKKYKARMEHFLGDLGAALYSGDNLYFLLSSAGFMKAASLVLFSINCRFSPSPKVLYKKLLSLKKLPPSFSVHLETFLSGAEEITPERKYGTANAIARGILELK